MDLIYTNELCTGCNKCVRACPVLTANVATEAGKVMVDSEKCIACGACFDACPHEARDYLDDTERFFADLSQGKKISVILGSGFPCKLSKGISEGSGIFEKEGSQSYLQRFLWCGYYDMGIPEIYHRA